jgi:exopolyphosphatase/guanosine-5'-triphosphate,3'-diphosphate pyrophosphatase
MRLGVLDVGSNTVHLQVMDAYIGAAPIASASFKHDLHLTDYLDENGAINSNGIAVLISAIEDVFNSAQELALDETLAFATSAIREAINSDQILEQVRKTTGIELEVLTGSDEAKFTFLAVRRWLGWSVGELLVIDIGGGSLEIAQGKEEIPSTALSLQLGAGRLTREFLYGDPFNEKSLNKLKMHIKESLLQLESQIHNPQKRYAYATSKTFRTLCRLQNEFMPEYGEHLTVEGVSLLLDKLEIMSHKERASLPGITKNRAKQIVAGAMVAQLTMKYFELEYLVSCPWALREGIVLHRLDWLK